VRVLLLHPEDNPLTGPWSLQTWDRIVDLGQAGATACQRWSDLFGCPVESLGSPDLKDYRRVRTLLAACRRSLIDHQGLDWWELIGLRFDQQIGNFLILQRFAEGLQRGAQVFATRAGLHASTLGQLLGREVRCFSPHGAHGKLARRYWGLARKFSVTQLGEIFWDKYDGDYQIRARLASRPKARDHSVVLLPSAYGNVSRMGVRYAEMLPDSQFLLVVTRRSGWLESLPTNVSASRLASYASGSGPEKRELMELLERWEDLRGQFARMGELADLDRLEVFTEVPHLLRIGLGIRNAWTRVLETEPVSSVLCCDDTNPNTHLPLLLARQRGLPTLTCHHGALDAGHLIKRNHADVVLAKGQMEFDYLTRVCGLSGEEVEIGGPASVDIFATKRSDHAPAPWIVFFSEPYELVCGRTEEFYRDLLAPLLDLAEHTGKEFVIKLHPMESLSERRRLVERVEPARHHLIQIVTGPLREELLQKTWCGVTVLSTAAMDCALHGIPCFLCQWLEYFSCGYGEQFAKFGAAKKIESAGQIATIPEMLKTAGWKIGVRSDLSNPIVPERLRALLSGGVAARAAAAV